MGLQLIFVVETDKKCQSDWMYVKDTIDWFYQYDHSHVKLSHVYMGGKGNYLKEKVLKEIKNLINTYASRSTENRSVVIFCFDCDEYDTKQEDADFLNQAKTFCRKNGYEWVWFCKDVERVYWGEKVEKKQKKKMAISFKQKHIIRSLDSGKLSKRSEQPVNNGSNILTVLDQYLDRK